MSKEEFDETCKILQKMGFAVYAVTDPYPRRVSERDGPAPEPKKTSKTLVNWNRELKMLIKQGK